MIGHGTTGMLGQGQYSKARVKRKTPLTDGQMASTLI